MCIAILTTPGKRITDEVFKRCWKNNSHGFGMAYVRNGEVIIEKGFMKVEAALNAYNRMVDTVGEHNPMLLHFRAATVGGINAANCHPFKVKGGAMIHNGTFYHDRDSEKSDSRTVAEVLHNQLTYQHLTEHKAEFDKIFGYNRVAFLYGDGKYVLFSEDYEVMSGKYGQWCDGVWYSNGGWAGHYNGYYGWHDAQGKPVNAFPDFTDEDDIGLKALDSALAAKLK